MAFSLRLWKPLHASVMTALGTEEREVGGFDCDLGWFDTAGFSLSCASLLLPDSLPVPALECFLH